MLTRRHAAARRNPAALGLAAALAACSGAVINFSDVDISYSPLEWRGVGALPVVVHGNPFPVPQADFDRAVVAGLNNGTGGTATTLIAAPEGSSSAYRVIASFPGGSTGDSLCQPGPASPGPPVRATPAAAAPDRVSLTAALCRGGRAITYADGTVGGKGGPEGAEFQSGLTQFALTLFPLSSPQANQPGG